MILDDPALEMRQTVDREIVHAQLRIDENDPRLLRRVRLWDRPAPGVSKDEWLPPISGLKYKA